MGREIRDRSKGGGAVAMETGNPGLKDTRTWGVIATWQMALSGTAQAGEILNGGGGAGDAVEALIRQVEACPEYTSVGYGGLPNREGVVELDAAYMDGDSLAQGAVAGIRQVRHPVSVARSLSARHANSFLVGDGAGRYARDGGFEMADMLTDRARDTWLDRLKGTEGGAAAPYDGHDTVGALALDGAGSMAAATSTSGLFMKDPGRVGDSPLPGSGFYADSQAGAAAATGLGEDIMKGCLSYEIVRRMREGADPQEACDRAVYPFVETLKRRYGKVGEISLIAIDPVGRFGVATNVDFTFCLAGPDRPASVFSAAPDGQGGTRFQTVRSDSDE